MNRTNILKVKGRVWFLWICLALDLVPKTLGVKIKDPKASDKQNYTEEMKEEWASVKKEVGRKLVKLAKQREEKIIRTKEEKWWQEARRIILIIGNEEWESAYTKMKREGVGHMRGYNNAHRDQIRSLILQQGRTIPIWLRKGASEFLEDTITVEKYGGRNRSRRARRRQDESMWVSWIEKREERNEKMRESIEKDIKETVKVISSTPKPKRENKEEEWDPSPIREEWRPPRAGRNHYEEWINWESRREEKIKERRKNKIKQIKENFEEKEKEKTKRKKRNKRRYLRKDKFKAKMDYANNKLK